MAANITHETQLQILSELLFHPSVHFADLQKNTNLTSDHFNFHLNKLIEIGFVEKAQKGEYRLTTVGKEYANRIDTDAKEIERQPKISVLLMIERDNNGKKEYLLQQRLKQPFYGFCTNCQAIIDTDRLGILPMATLCKSCEEAKKILIKT